ncbi:hypothetical protein LTR95_012952 [Oleoguttula sp. CCFEE 5521]
MPRPKKDGSAEPKKRSRTGCWPCKAKKIRCPEERPACATCVKNGTTCDYSIRLTWGGRSKKDQDDLGAESGSFTFVATPESFATPSSRSAKGGFEHVFSAQPSPRPQSAPRQPKQERPTSHAGPDAVPGAAPIMSIDPSLQLAKLQDAPHDYQAQSGQDLPPYAQLSASVGTPSTSSTATPPTWSPDHSSKRMKLSPRMPFLGGQPSPPYAVPRPPSMHDQQSPDSTYYTPHSISSIVNTPATPGSSISTTSPFPPPPPAPMSIQDPPDLRRLSVKSLLSDPSDESMRPQHVRSDSHSSRLYGYDHGLPDLDAPRNDDRGAIGPRSPDLRRTSDARSETSTSSAEAEARQMAFEPGGYYDKPVPVRVPRALEPLPFELSDNPMNLLYFHHFLNHTARILVPHDCPENPLRSVLPQMAVRNKHLLHLMLAFSASHRARLLDHPEPANRIAQWMSDVFPASRRALNEPSSPGSADPADPNSLAPLATAIMLASLEIISPNTFVVPITWQNHLQVARQFIVARGGLHDLAQRAAGARDRAAISFLSRWFAYLDVLGSMSGGRQTQPLCGAYLEDGGGLWLVNRSDAEIYQIDCFFGFSGRCIALLAGVAELAWQCDKERINPITRSARPGWRPSEAVATQAEELKERLQASAKCVYGGCMHTTPTDGAPDNAKSEQDINEIYATNEAYHWAGMIHLSRRVLNLPSTSEEVQKSVNHIVRSLSAVRKGSTAESCLLFPIFTAGCEALTDEQRRLFMERLTSVEGWGMQHVSRARKLMQRVWETGAAWEGMADGEFIG